MSPLGDAALVGVVRLPGGRERLAKLTGERRRQTGLSLFLRRCVRFGMSKLRKKGYVMISL